MRARLHTLGRDLGLVDLVDGVDVREVHEAVRSHRLFCTPIVEPAATSATPATATTLSGGEVQSDRGPGKPHPNRKAT